MSTESAAWARLSEHMPTEIAAALAKFNEVEFGRGRYSGIDWWTALEIMVDCDAHLDIIEPLAEVFKEDGEAWTVLHSYVALTLIYASEAFSITYTDEMRAVTMRAMIENNK